MFRNAVQYVQRIYPNIGLLIGKPDQRIVKKDIEPLFIKFLFLSYQKCLACIYDLIISYVIFQVLHNLNAHINVELSMTINQLTYVLPLVRALLDYLTIVLEQVIYEEFVKVISWTPIVLIYPPC